MTVKAGVELDLGEVSSKLGSISVVEIGLSNLGDILGVDSLRRGCGQGFGGCGRSHYVRESVLLTRRCSKCNGRVFTR